MIHAGYEYLVRPVYFRFGDKIRCPKCARKQSKIEKIVINEILNNLNSEYLEGISISNRSIINPFELDLYIPKLNLAIEFNGLYWHSEVYKDKFYHKAKYKKCNENGIELIQIFEDDWNINKLKILDLINKKYNNRDIEFITDSKNYIINSTLDILLNKELFSKFISERKNEIFILLDNSYINNNYKYFIDLGFIIEEEIDPSYLYTDGHLRFKEKSDKEYCVKIWDCGKTLLKII